MADPAPGAIFATILGPDDADLLVRASSLFDNPVRRPWAEKFLQSENNHLALATVAGVPVGFASGITYVHPDKPAELWINEVGVDGDYRRRGIGKAVVACLCRHAKSLGAAKAWVFTDAENFSARGLYGSLDGVESETVMVTIPL
ncbi:MAG: GNAT family N-acetyltransferase [Pseudomonadota bacterium]